MAARRVKEWLARGLVALLAIGPLAAVLGARRSGQAVVLEATMPEVGGWRPGTLTAEVAKPLRLRLTSGDVVHGFAIGRDSMQPVDIKPGRVTEITLRFDRPGTYMYYCTRWCGPNHWRMRGTIEVTGAGVSAAPSPPAPYIALGMDLDAPHPTAVRPARRPSAARGGALAAMVPGGDSVADARRDSPAMLWQRLRHDRALRRHGDQELWDLVAARWLRSTSAAALETGRRLYVRDCAACHGTGGRGDGVMAAGLRAKASDTSHRQGADGHVAAGPADFTAPDLLAASPALLHGKIVRGGMGTGMPSWASVYTDAEAWAIVWYLYGFQFSYDIQGDER
jgi:mono/diheme cytochrome c family protein/plastocyanin